MLGILTNIPWVLESAVLDREWQYVLLKEKLNNQRVQIVGVYAANKSQAPFWERVYWELLENLQDPVLMMGDFNIFFYHQLVRSSDSSTPGFPLSFLNYKKELHLVDVWRKNNGNLRDYTFYSYRHKSYSRTDLVLVSEDIKSKVICPAIGLQILSDHAPISVDWKDEPVIPWPQFWCLN